MWCRKRLAREALATLSDAGSELLEAVSGVLRGEQFVGKRFSGHDFARASQAGVSPDLLSNGGGAQL